MDILPLALVGAVAGTLAGLLGIGGGVVIVPILALFFEHQQVAGEVVMQCAVGTSLATIVFTATSSVRAHHRRGAVRWPVFRQLTPGILVGALAGTGIGHWLESDTLQAAFGVFLLLVAAQMTLPLAAADRQLPRPPWMLASGGVIGMLSALFGIGGGAISVPFLTWRGMQPVQAVATASAIGLPIAIAGTTGYIVAGLQVDEVPPWSIGYVVLPALAGIVVASTLFAPVGAWVAHQLHPTTLRRIFAVLLGLFGLRMLLG